MNLFNESDPGPTSSDPLAEAYAQRLIASGLTKTAALLHMANLPLDANVLVMTVMATAMPLVGRG